MRSPSVNRVQCLCIARKYLLNKWIKRKWLCRTCMLKVQTMTFHYSCMICAAISVYHCTQYRKSFTQWSCKTEGTFLLPISDRKGTVRENQDKCLWRCLWSLVWFWAEAINDIFTGHAHITSNFRYYFSPSLPFLQAMLGIIVPFLDAKFTCFNSNQ